MNMMVAGLNGVPFESVVGPPEVIAKKPGRDIAIHPGHLKKAYHVLEPIQSQKIVTRNYALVGTLDILRAIKYYSYIFNVIKYIMKFH